MIMMRLIYDSCHMIHAFFYILYAIIKSLDNKSFQLYILVERFLADM